MGEWTTETWQPTPRHVTWRATVDALIDAEEQRWFLWLPVMFGVGIAAYFSLSTEPALALLACVMVAVAVLRHLSQPSLTRLALSAALAIVAGAFAAKARTEIVRAPVLERFTGPVSVEGWIERVEPRATGGQRITLRVTSLGTFSDAQRPERIRMRLQREDKRLRPGMAIRARVSLGPPPAPAAPGDFDFGRLAFFSGLAGLGTAFGAAEIIQLDRPAPLGLRLQAPVETLRQAIRARILEALPGEAGEIATALITGERGGISEDTNQAYRNSGLFHILSISGLHMVIMAGAVFYLLRFVLALFPSIALTRPIKTWAAAGAITGAFGYLMISGASFATVRSYVMITIMFAAVMLDRPALSLRNVALAALLILVPYPESLFDAGFQMSFVAVVGLVAAYDWLRERRERLGAATLDVSRGPIAQGFRFFWEIVLSTLVASIVVAPFGVYHFHNTQLLSVIANVFAIPVCNLVVMPAALGVLILLPFGGEALPLWIMGHGIEAMTTVARWVGALPGAVVKVPAIPSLAFALMVGGGLWLLLWSQSWRLLGAIPIVAGLALAPSLARPDVLIGRDGLTLAVRGPGGRLSALAVRGSSFDLSRWLERDGDSRSAAEVSDARAFQCDAIGCIASVAGKRLSVVLNAASLRDDCTAADIIVARVRVVRGCGETARAGQVLIDPAMLANGGAHALYIEAGRVHIETVAGARGNRPWSTRTVTRQDDAATDRTPGFTALFERFRGTREGN